MSVHDLRSYINDNFVGLDFKMIEESLEMRCGSIPTIMERNVKDHVVLLTFNYEGVKEVMERYGYVASTGVGFGRDFICYLHHNPTTQYIIHVYSVKSDNPSFEAYRNVIKRIFAN